MKYKALLFGSIGTLIESSNIQRNSFNEAFKEAGLDWYWDEQEYKILLKKSGGTKRVEDFAEKNNVNVNASQIRNRKTDAPHVFSPLGPLWRRTDAGNQRSSLSSTTINLGRPESRRRLWLGSDVPCSGGLCLSDGSLSDYISTNEVRVCVVF